MIGLESGVVRLVPYTEVWAQLFAEEKARLESALGDAVLAIQHVGSTSIPGMVAKPIIDIAIAVEDFEEARTCIKPLEQLDYEYKGEMGIPRRHYFVKGDPRTHHIHINELGSLGWETQIFFRDALIQQPDLAQAYATLKKELAAQYPRDREAYLAGKAPFIERVLTMIRLERQKGGR